MLLGNYGNIHSVGICIDYGRGLALPFGQTMDHGRSVQQHGRFLGDCPHSISNRSVVSSMEINRSLRYPERDRTVHDGDLSSCGPSNAVSAKSLCCFFLCIPVAVGLAAIFGILTKFSLI